jgi:hypothetical protein
MGLIVAILRIVTAGLALSAPPAQAQALFGTTSPPVAGDSVFYRIDPTTGAATPIGPLGFSRVSGIAFHPTTGVLYAVGFDGLTHVLLTIDNHPSAGALFAVMDCHGQTYRLGTLNTSTGVITEIGQSVFGLDAIAFQPGTALELSLTDFRDVRRPNGINI